MTDSTEDDPQLPGVGRKINTRRKAVDAKTKQLQNAKKKAAAAKRSLTAATKKITAIEKVDDALTGKAPTIVTTDEIEELAPNTQAYLEEEKVIFRPHPGPQTDFLAATEREVLYGGAAGGGKSYAMLVDPLRYCGHPDSRAIVFRRTNDELRELIEKSHDLYPQAYPGAKWKESKSAWYFPSGATLWFTYLEADQDVRRYQGQAFNYVGFDELTNWPTPFCWDYMRSRLRTAAKDLPLNMRATTNPGGVGGWWVRKMFIDPAPWGQAFPATNIETGEIMRWTKGPKEGQPLFNRRFIPARLSDNPTLYESGEYEANLLSMPEAQRRQLLEGDWDVSEGAAFTEFNRATHVCDPFEIPDSWTKFRAADWGFTQPAVCLWFAIDEDQNLWVYRELHVTKMVAEDFAAKVLELEQGEDIKYGIMDGSLWDNRGVTGPTLAETMIRAGCRWRKADKSPGSRKAGKLQIHRRLAKDPDTGNPSLKFFSNCVNTIRTLPTLPLDKNNPEDIDSRSDDHCYDALRYGIMSRPINTYSFEDPFGKSRSSGFQMADQTFGY